MASSISEARRRPYLIAVAAFAVIGLCGARIARAQPAVASDANREAARAKLVDGVAALKRDDYQAALSRFEEAYALVPSPKIHYDFGLAYVGLGRSAEALAAFERFLAEAPDAPADKRERATAMVAKLRADGGKVPRDGSENGPQASGLGPQAQIGPQASGLGPQTQRSDSDLQARGPFPAAERAEPAVVVTPASEDRMRALRIAGLSVGAAGVGLLAVGVVFGVLAQHEDDSLTRDSQMATADRPTPFDPGKESRGVAYERLQIVGLIGGVVLTAAGAALYATGRRRAVVEPVAGPTFAGATARLVF